MSLKKDPSSEGIFESKSDGFKERVKELLFSKSGFVLVSSHHGPEYIDKLFKDGSRITGHLVNGEFEEIKDPSTDT